MSFHALGTMRRWLCRLWQCHRRQSIYVNMWVYACLDGLHALSRPTRGCVSPTVRCLAPSLRCNGSRDVPPFALWPYS